MVVKLLYCMEVNIRSWDDVFKHVSKECKADPQLPNFEPEDINFIHKFLWQTVGYYLRNPELSRKGIVIQNFIRFELREYYLKNLINIFTQKQCCEKSIERYTELLKQIDKHGTE